MMKRNSQCRIVKPQGKARKGYSLHLKYNFFDGYLCTDIYPAVGDEELKYRPKYEIVGDLQRRVYEDFLKFGYVQAKYYIPYENKEDSKTVEFVVDYVVIDNYGKVVEFSFDFLHINK